MGRGLLADADAPLLGTYLGVAGEPEITRAVEDSDALFLLGVILSDTNFGVSDAQDRHAQDACTLRPARHAWATTCIPSIALGGAGRRAAGARPPPAAASARRRAARAIRTGCAADAAPIAPMDIARAVNDVMAAHGRMPIASDIGDCLFTALDIAQHRAGGARLLRDHGLRRTRRAWACRPASGQRPLILVGDGAFQMTGWELGNCQRYGWDPIVHRVQQLRAGRCCAPSSRRSASPT